jgi:outer membrane protein OmpA-like peptidoglycan-associated protein
MFRRIKRLMAILIAGMGLTLAGTATAHEDRLFAVYFEKDGSVLSEYAEPVLDAAADFYQSTFRGERVCLISHTDTVGSARDNLARSQIYATRVMDRLVYLGVPAEKITFRALGESGPPVATLDETDEPLNRQVAIYHGDYGWRTYCGDAPPIVDDIIFTVRFEADAYEVRADDKAVQETYAYYLASRTEATHPARLAIVGYADRHRDTADHSELSHRRAIAVADRLVELGLPKDIIAVGWKGVTPPGPINGDPDVENRLVEIWPDF